MYLSLMVHTRTYYASLKFDEPNLMGFEIFFVVEPATTTTFPITRSSQIQSAI